MTSSPNPDPYKLHVGVLTVAFIVTIPAIMAATLVMRPAPPVDPFAEVADRLGVSPLDLHRGQSIYGRTCTTCHGADAAGIPHVGKPLRNSAFVQTHSNEELLALVAKGRLPSDPANTTGIPMPPRGAQGLADDQIEDVVLYLRTLQDPGAPTASLEPWTRPPEPAVPAIPPAAPTASTSTGSEDLFADASGASAPSEQDTPPTGAAPARAVPIAARDAFVTACSSCHGPDGAGLPNLGKPLTTSEFVRSKTDDELIAFIKTGRPMWDAENTTGVDMPPKGGNPALTDSDLTKIVTFIRFLQEGS